ncbi:DUF2460 domain-containing protein [Crocosphaera sp.]|uniref:DUF2460 domain-containing protein n=1 Tax=Crocosphaera sp. TaxID=2729996 RepID=UPI00262D625C|nr:DUF2460 domain-containing protein [Crocosphaera sp.]MDJ0579103.1 DUF2460 domain-containing protein [Crocosphaera sp.]
MILDQTFPIEYNVRIGVNITFDNIITKNNNLSEQRIIQNEYPTREYSLFKNIVTPQDLTLLRTFFETTKGSFKGFLFKDPLDNSVTENIVNILNSDCSEQGRLYPDPDGVRTEFQVIKEYRMESSVYRQPIYYPYNLRLYQDGTEIFSGFTQDKGKIVFDTPPIAFIPGNPFDILSITASFDFYYPCRFKTDVLEDKIVTRTDNDNKIYGLNNLEIVEVKQEFDIYPESSFSTLSNEIAVNLRWGQTFQTQRKTNIKTSISNIENRTQKQVNAELFLDLQSKQILSQQQAQYLLYLWLNIKGNGRAFKYRDAVSDTLFDARFDTGSLSFTNQSANYIWELQQTTIKLFNNGQIVDRFHLEFDKTIIVVIVDNSRSSEIFNIIWNASENVKNIMLSEIYNNDQALADDYFLRLIGTNASIRYLDIMQADRRPNTNVPEKYLYLYYLNESEFGYHSRPRNPGEEPEEIYNTDLSSFETKYNNDYAIFNCTFLADAANPYGYLDHITDAVNGGNGYNTPLSGLGMDISIIDFTSPTAQADVEALLLSKIRSRLIGERNRKGNDKTCSPELYLCYVLKITTQLNDVYAYTSHDKNIVINGVTYKASGALSPTAYSAKSSLAFDSVRNECLFVDFEETLIFSGVLKNATLEIAVVDWIDPPDNLNGSDPKIVDYQKGIVGEITSHSGEYYSIEFLSFAASKLNQTFVRKTQSNCPYRFMSEECGYPATEWTGTVEDTVSANWIRISGGYNAGQLRNGRITFTSGELKGTSFAINKIEESDKFVLNNFVLKSPAVGDTVKIEPGCLKTVQACKAYNNFINFGGIPTDGGWMPGDNVLINAPRQV